MTAIVDAFIEDARSVSIAEAAKVLGLVFRRSGVEHPQPCPVTGGKDRFSFNTAKNSWNCRGCGNGGRDAIGMAAHVLDLDLSRRDGFIEACSAVLGQPIPDEGERESDADRAARLDRIEARRRSAEAEAARRERDQADYRERERARARGIYEHAPPLTVSRTGRAYLQNRGCVVPETCGHLRLDPLLTYWHGQDERGDPASLHVGPAMVAAFIDAGRAIVGCHITWIDLANPPKYRPLITDPETGEILPTKKMRGSKKGGLIPVLGYHRSRRWVGGEGIENTLAVATWEDFRTDTFYFAAGDLGNLAGPADPASAFPHPSERRTDKRGVSRPVMVAGPAPKPESAHEAMWVGDWVSELVLLADADSERVMTAAAMARARARHAAPGRLTTVVWPKHGHDLADLAVELA